MHNIVQWVNRWVRRSFFSVCEAFFFCSLSYVWLTHSFVSLVVSGHSRTHRSSRLHFILEQLLGSKLENVVQLLFGHGARFGAQTGPHHQVSQHHFPLRHLSDPLLHGAPSHKAIDHHLLVLANAMRSAESLGEGRDRGGEMKRCRNAKAI